MRRVPLIHLLIALLALLFIAADAAAVYNTTLGRWMRRDPVGYVDGANMYGYVNAHSVHSVDPTGLIIVIISPTGAHPPTFQAAYGCCQEYFSHNPESGGKTLCAYGHLVSCINDGHIWDSAGPDLGLAAAVVACTVQCEPTHWAHFHCGFGGIGCGHGLTPNKGDSFSCSECAAYDCLNSCLQQTCGGSPDHCPVCHGVAECEHGWAGQMGAAAHELMRFCLNCVGVPAGLLLSWGYQLPPDPILGPE